VRHHLRRREGQVWSARDQPGDAAGRGGNTEDAKGNWKVEVGSGGTFLSTAIEIIKWVNKFAVAQAKVTHILRPGKASEKTPKGVIPPSLCEISQNASRKKKLR
jgi:hypothetical protein